MPSGSEIHLSRRERQIMDIVYRRGRAFVSDVHQDIPNRPSYSAVRTMMRILEAKGYLRHEKSGNKYVYSPTQSRRRAGRSAAKRFLKTFSDGSMAQAVAALLNASETKPTGDELDRVTAMIEKIRKEGR